LEAEKPRLHRRTSNQTERLRLPPGIDFTFGGCGFHLDLHLGLLALVDPREQKSYEISFDPTRIRRESNLRGGANATRRR
jgi:hypothetical protein